ncbi:MULTISPECIES: NADPH-dependent oxidoreductase [Limosilactobacillus]|uniref:Nitroreductase n=1 Tax=Limosilactobacillus panis DSM 6035 TaxID=1423782 RepID=A0A0R1XFE7_9LACO|nr:NADPH-dependent oxidoreductase [Limosilactobacillus panis]KRM25580.1 nitroreductase [Limosilactobacillus panis DSM 6035]
MIHNETIDHQVNHRTIRAFKEQPLNEEQLTTLYEAARHASTSMFMQQFSILHVTDPHLRTQVREISQQPYVGANGDLFIFIVDLYRNQQIREQEGNDDGRLHTTDIFMQAVEDTTLAVQNFLTAAESMGLGGVILGSIQNNLEKLVQVLNMPKMTLPFLGIQVGVPDQEPQLKPRLPQRFIAFENHYPRGFKVADLAEYDQVVTQYYDLRDANRRIDSFTKQINGDKLNKHFTKRDEFGLVAQKQGFALDWGKDLPKQNIE